LGDERILGSPDFVEAVRQDVAQAAPSPRKSAVALETVIARVCESLGIVPAALVAGGRTARVSRARAGTSPTSG